MSNSSVTPFLKWAGKRHLIPQMLLANALINDINKDLINAYKQICNSPDAFLKAVNKLDKEMWEDGKKYYYSL